ncbi:MAG: hypothetical protein ACOC56_00335 [Atribacterota bacterium]
MKKLLLLNTDSVISSAFSDEIECSSDCKSCDWLFIDWLPVNQSSKPNEKLIDQTLALDYFINNKKPVCIYDRYLSIQNKEYNWLINKNVKIFEPSVILRKKSEFLFWLPNNIEFSKGKRNVLGYIGNIYNKIGQFEKYFINFSSSFTSKDIVVCVPDLQKEYNSSVEFKQKLNHNEIYFTVLISTKHETDIGYIPDIMNIMNNGCVPLLPDEHKWLHALFNGCVIKNYNDLEYLISHTDLAYGMIMDISENFKKYLPETKIENVIDKIYKTFSNM